MKSLYFLLIVALISGCKPDASHKKPVGNPFFNGLNDPIDYGRVTAADLDDYARSTLDQVVQDVKKIEAAPATFEDIFVAFDDLSNALNKAYNNCHTLYWVSPDSLTRVTGLAGFQLLDSLSNQLSSNKVLYEKMTDFAASEAFSALIPHRKKFVLDMIDEFEQSGVNLEPAQLEQFKQLNKEITKLSSQYSNIMNTADRVLTLDEEGVTGLPENFKQAYRVKEGQYEVPVIPATRGPIMENAANEETRKAFIMEYDNRGSEGNMEILDQLIHKRYEVGKLMGYDSYAGFNLKPKMAEKPENVWGFLQNLIAASRPKAIQDYEKLKAYRNQVLGTQNPDPVKPWNTSYYRNQLLKSQYQVDHEKIREYLPMESCLAGMMDIYQELLGYEFRKVNNPSVWHEEVELYEVYEGESLQGRFYLDLFPRPNKESWFYGVGLKSGKLTDEGYEVPVAMLLGNFTRPTDDLPSLLSHGELRTLFHEFGHIMDGMSYKGEYSAQSGSKRDFVEAMSQIFENWIWDYDMLSSFANHYETGETLPKEMFDKMLAAKNVTSGLSAIGSLRSAIYDMTIYDSYDPQNPISTDSIWVQIDREIDISNNYVSGTHPQASWIHINGYPVYYYGYIWSDVYAQDMFTEFKKNGLLDQETGVRYRKTILANGSQRDVVEAVEAFLGRSSDNAAYIQSLGLE